MFAPPARGFFARFFPADAGIYIPTLMSIILKRGVITNVKGVAIGNGCWGTTSNTNCGDVTGHSGLAFRIDIEVRKMRRETLPACHRVPQHSNRPTYQSIGRRRGVLLMISFSQYFLGRGLISPALKSRADAACGDWSDPLPKACHAAYHNISHALGPINIDNMDDTCPDAELYTLSAHRAAGKRFFARGAGAQQQRAIQLTAAAALGDDSGGPAHDSSSSGSSTPTPIGEVQMWCGAEASLKRWQHHPAVIQALHVRGPPHAYHYTVEEMDLSPLYRELANLPNLNFVIYNGLADANVRDRRFNPHPFNNVRRCTCCC